MFCSSFAGYVSLGKEKIVTTDDLAFLVYMEINIQIDQNRETLVLGFFQAEVKVGAPI